MNLKKYIQKLIRKQAPVPNLSEPTSGMDHPGHTIASEDCPDTVTDRAGALVDALDGLLLEQADVVNRRLHRPIYATEAYGQMIHIGRMKTALDNIRDNRVWDY